MFLQTEGEVLTQLVLMAAGRWWSAIWFTDQHVIKGHHKRETHKGSLDFVVFLFNSASPPAPPPLSHLSPPSPSSHPLLEAEFEECGAVSRGYGGRLLEMLGRNRSEGAKSDRNSPCSFFFLYFFSGLLTKKTCEENHRGSAYCTKETETWPYSITSPEFCLLIHVTATDL